MIEVCNLGFFIFNSKETFNLFKNRKNKKKEFELQNKFSSSLKLASNEFGKTEKPNQM